MVERSKLWLWADKWVIPLMVFTVVIFALFVATIALDNGRQFDPITYSIQSVERIEEDGTITVPSIEGVGGPAVYLSSTVPVRGAVTNDADHAVSTEGSILWVEQPPGLRVVAGSEIPGLFPVGTTQIKFENRIPEGVYDHVMHVGGPSQWYITGVTDVLEPGGVATTWQTATFTLVPDGWMP